MDSNEKYMGTVWIAEKGIIQSSSEKVEGQKQISYDVFQRPNGELRFEPQKK